MPVWKDRNLHNEEAVKDLRCVQRGFDRLSLLLSLVHALP